MIKEAGPQMYEKVLEKEPLSATVGQVRFLPGPQS